MSLTELQLSSFVRNWVGKPQSQVAEELASLSMETKRIPDPYYFEYNLEGKLISPETGKLAEKSIEKMSPLGRVEYEGFLLVEDLGWKNKSGTIIWVSPPHLLRSNFTKVVVTEIGDRSLFNRAILLDMNEEESLEFMNKLNPDFIYRSSTEIRGLPVYLPDNSFEWNIFSDYRQVEMIVNGEDIKEKQEALKWGRLIAHDISNVVQISKQIGIFGSYDTSCPPTAFQVFSGETFDCPRCKGKIRSGQGITTCPHCKLKKEDYGSNCD
ncbi:MAG: hypothetical protein AAB656_04650 [Patescibacteria group bacterium]